MSISALVIGYGSIGKKHIDILNSMEIVDSVTVLSNQKNLPYKTIRKIEEIPKLDPNYIVIASNTSLHYGQLSYLLENLNGKKILVEKPLFDTYKKCVTNDNKVFVGYNLRFHPIIKKIKNEIKNKHIWSIQINCGSYLPDWRPKRDYRKTSSANKLSGGGVLLDLSHELDYAIWLVGRIDLKYVLNQKVSDLEIDTDDLLIIYGESNSATIQISLNYFTRKPIRQIIFEGEGISIQADLISNNISIFKNDELYELSWPSFNVKETYFMQHNAVINNNIEQICTFEEGLKTMGLIDKIRKFNG